jgi:outer membrane receptor protein involved in Fe transport
MQFFGGGVVVIFLAVLAAADPSSAQPGAPAASSAQPTPATEVKTVTVTADRARAVTLIDRKVYTVGTDLQATTGAAADVLSNIPSVEVDADGNVSLRGDPSVTILIDGKPSAAFAGSSRGLSLQQLPASQIDRIEVLTNPPAQYKAEGSGGVINIVTRKARRPGLTGGMQVSLGDKRRFVSSANLGYSQGPLKLSVAVGLRREARERVISDARTLRDPSSGDLVQSSELLDEKIRRLIPSGRAELEYAPNDRQTLTASISRRDLTGDRFFDQFDRSGPVALPATAVSLRHSDGHEWNAEGDQGLRFEQKLWRPDETLSIGLQRSAEHERERYFYANSFTLPVQAQSFDDLHLSHDLIKTEFSLDYALPLGADRGIKAGLDVEDDRNRFDNRGDTVDPVSGDLLVDPNVTYDYRFHQKIWAGYLQGQTTWGPWHVQPGLRWERTDISAAQVAGSITPARSFAGVYPSLNLERDLTDSSRLLISASRRLNRPDPEILNPFVDHQDIHNLRGGNPNLRPEDITAFETGWTRSADGASQGLTAYYRLFRDSITSVITPVGPDVVLFTVANLPKRRTAGLEMRATGKLGPTLSYNLSANAFWQEIDTTGLIGSQLSSGTGVNGKASLEWRPTASDLAQVSVNRTDRRLTPQGSIGAINIVNLGYRHQFSSTLAGVITLSDAFDGQHMRRFSNTADLQDVYDRHQVGQIAYLGLTWTFSGQKKAKGAGFEYEQ